MKDSELSDGSVGHATSVRSSAGEFVRFLIVGVANTVVAYASYLALLRWLPYEVAFGVGYVLGIAVSYVLSATFVFRQPMRARSAIQFPLIYALQFILSIGLLKLAVDMAGIPHWLAPVPVIAITIPVTFLLSRFVLRMR